MARSDHPPSWRDEAALERFEMIFPIISASPDKAKMSLLRKAASEEHGISERTLRRYEKAYMERGLQGLVPAERASRGPSPLPENFEELLEQAIELRREVPSRSVADIIEILELEDRVEPGVLKRETLQRHMYSAGFGAEQMRQYTEARTSSSKRYTKPHRMMMLQADIKEGRQIPIGPEGRKTTVYVTSIIDVHSRFILYSSFYEGEAAGIVEDTIREAVLRNGKPDMIYCDHGSQYVSRHLRMACAALGIRIRYAPVKSGKSKGVVERFHQTVDSYLEEAKIQHIQSFDELNRRWNDYLDMEYQNKPHSGIREYYQQNFNIKLPPEGITPKQEWDRDTRALVHLDKDVVARAFLHHENRKVDKGACIRFQGRKYEAKPALIGRTVEITYDPRTPQTITVHARGIDPFESTPMRFEEYCAPNPALPEYMTGKKPESSRLLDAIEKKRSNAPQHYADALSFADYAQKGNRNE